MRFEDLTGQIFGRWKVLNRTFSKPRVTTWLCRCSCGTEREVQAGHLKTGKSASCGCWQGYRRVKHGQASSMTRKYRCWRSMKQRCNDPKGKNAAIYFGLLCEAWQNFTQFNADMPDPPSDSHELDRIDNSKGYAPGNVRWATRTEQNRNSRNCRLIEHNGEQKLLTDWAKQFDVSVATMHKRIKKWGTPTGR